MNKFFTLSTLAGLVFTLAPAGSGVRAASDAKPAPDQYQTKVRIAIYGADGASEGEVTTRVTGTHHQPLEQNLAAFGGWKIKMLMQDFERAGKTQYVSRFELVKADDSEKNPQTLTTPILTILPESTATLAVRDDQRRRIELEVRIE